MDYLDIAIQAKFQLRKLVADVLLPNPLRIEESAFSQMGMLEALKVKQLYADYLDRYFSPSEYEKVLFFQLSEDWSDLPKLFFFCWSCYNSLNLPLLMQAAEQCGQKETSSLQMINLFILVVDLILKITKEEKLEWHATVYSKMAVNFAPQLASIYDKITAQVRRV